MFQSWIFSQLSDSEIARGSMTVDDDGTFYFSCGTNAIYFEPNYLAEVFVQFEGTKFGEVYYKNKMLYTYDAISNVILTYSLENKELSTLLVYDKLSQKEEVFTLIKYMSMDKNGRFIVLHDASTIKKIDLSKGSPYPVETIGQFALVWEEYHPFITPPTKILAISTDGTVYVWVSDDNTIRQIKDGVASNVISTQTPVRNLFLNYGIPVDGSFDMASVLDPEYIFLMSKYPVLLLVEDQRYKLRILNLKNRTVSTLNHPRIRGIDMIHETREGDLVVVCGGVRFKITDSWARHRWLWIGHLKEGAEYCWLAKIPTEIIREIAKQIVVELKNSEDILV